MFLAVVVASTLTPAISWAQESAPAAPQAAPMLSPATDVIAFPVRPNDTLHIVVTGADDMSGDFRVDANDGTIAIARLGTIAVSGLAQQPIIDRIVQRIHEKKLLKQPNVAVYLTGRKAREIVINGAVQTQGTRVVKDGAALSEVLEGAMPSQTADLSRVVLTRDGKDQFIDYKRFQSGDERGETVNPILKDGDKIYVYSSVQSAGVVRIIGEIKDSTKVSTPITSGTTVGQLIQQVGGLTDYADRTGIVIVRDDKRIPVPYQQILAGTAGADVKLQDRDILVIPRQERPKQFTIAGAVRDPKTVMLIPGDSLTMTDALARAGGPIDGAKQDKIEVLRRAPDGSVTKKVIDLQKSSDATLAMQDGDYIFVPYASHKSQIDPFSAVGLLSGLSVIFTSLRH